MQNGERWTHADGTEMEVLCGYWKIEKRDEDEARLRSRFSGRVELTQDDHDTETPGFEHTYYISVPAADRNAAANALWGL